MPSISLPWAIFFYNVSSVALVSGAVVVLAGTIGNVWMGSVKERYGDDRIAANEAKTAQANEVAATANVRAAELALQLEKERTARLLIEERVNNQGEQVLKLMPRRLADVQRAELLKILPSATSSVAVAHDMAAGDAKTLANEVAEVFNSSGWRVITPQVMGLGNPPTTGIALRVANLANLTATEFFVKDAFEKAGLLFDLQPGRRVPPPGIIPGSGFAGMPVEMYPEVEIILTTPLR